MKINIPIINGKGSVLSTEIPEHLGALVISCPNNLDRISPVDIFFTGSTMLLQTSVPLNSVGHTFISNSDLGVVTGISVIVYEPEGVTSMDVEFIEWTEEFPVI